jgi:hypothetical protein
LSESQEATGIARCQYCYVEPEARRVDHSVPDNEMVVTVDVAAAHREAEVMPALPAPMAAEQQCVCGHGRNAHPADGPCELCAYKGIRACGLYSSMEDAEEIRALRKLDPFA